MRLERALSGTRGLAFVGGAVALQCLLAVALPHDLWAGDVGPWLTVGLILLGAGLTGVLALRTPLYWLPAGGVFVAGIGVSLYLVKYADRDPVPLVTEASLTWIYSLVSTAGGVAIGMWMLTGRSNARHWVFGLGSALAVAGAAAAIFAGLLPVVEERVASDGDLIAMMVVLMADLALVGCAVGIFVITGGRPGRTWNLVTIACLARAIADVAFVVVLLNGGGPPSLVSQTLWVVTSLLIPVICVAFRPRLASGDMYLPSRAGSVATPWVPWLLCIATLAYAGLAGASPLAVVFAAGGALTLMAAVSLTTDEHVDVIQQTSEIAYTDALTRLPNRRKLTADLERGAEEASRQRPLILAIYDLDGFKAYNDSYGHPAGDDLLARLAGKLAAAVTGRGTAYRLGGDEFCILTHDPGLLETARLALSDDALDVVVTASGGAARIPQDARDATEALGVADRHLYGQKRARRRARLTGARAA